MHQTRLVQLSKLVGWEEPLRTPLYPTRDAVLHSINHIHEDFHAARLLSWNRFLPSPVDNYQRSVIDLVRGGMAKLT